MYYSASSYSPSSSTSTSSMTPPSIRKYPTTYRESYTSSREYRSPYSTSSSYLSSRTPSSLTSSSRPFTSRFLRSRYHYDSDDDSHNHSSSNHNHSNNNEDTNHSNSENGQSPEKKVVVVDHANGAVIKIRRRREFSTSDEEEINEEETTSAEATPEEVEPEPEPEPEPEEDPLDREERELREQLMLSLTLTLVDEENLRQRLLEIKKTRLRQQEREATELALIQKFQKVADVALFENSTMAASSRDEEEKTLIHRLSAESLSDVDRKDVHVRLQEIFRDQRNALDKSLREVELHYEHILQETSTELTELETSIRNKAEQVEKLQNEMLTMTVRKELLSRGMEQVNESHGQRVSALNENISKIESKMSDYAVIVVQSTSPLSTAGNGAPTTSLSARAVEELRELERELECPVCMDISHPPIYQCEEGHIICSNCKPLLTNCPHNCGQRYSEPAIRCRFAEKLAERYFKTVMKHKLELENQQQN